MRAILTYHSIDESGSVISVAESVFRRHVAWLARADVRVVSVEELLRLPATANAVALTFDDGFESVGRIAAPLLADHGMTATVFVVSDAVGTTNRWPHGLDRGVPELPLLDWDALGAWAERGMAVGAHSRTHPRLDAIDEARVLDEVTASADSIAARLGHRPTVFAYPYGNTSPAVERIVAAHYSFGCTTELRPIGATERPALLPRLDMYYYRHTGLLEQWGTARFRYRLSLRASARRVRHRYRTLLRRT